jgi:hypothetical protein
VNLPPEDLAALRVPQESKPVADESNWVFWLPSRRIALMIAEIAHGQHASSMTSMAW